MKNQKYSLLQIKFADLTSGVEVYTYSTERHSNERNILHLLNDHFWREFQDLQPWPELFFDEIRVLTKIVILYKT